MNSAPEFVLRIVDLHENLIQMSLRLSTLPHIRCAFRLDIASEDRSKLIGPELDALVTHIDNTPVEQVFNVSERKYVSVVHHHSEANDLRRRIEIVKWVFGHRPTLGHGSKAQFR